MSIVAQTSTGSPLSMYSAQRLSSETPEKRSARYSVSLRNALSAPSMTVE